MLGLHNITEASPVGKIMDDHPRKAAVLSGPSEAQEKDQGLANVPTKHHHTSSNYWGYNLQQIWEGDVQNPQNGTFYQSLKIAVTVGCFDHPLSQPISSSHLLILSTDRVSVRYSISAG